MRHSILNLTFFFSYISFLCITIIIAHQLEYVLDTNRRILIYKIALLTQIYFSFGIKKEFVSGRDTPIVAFKNSSIFQYSL